jgi:hypothetical protein
MPISNPLLTINPDRPNVLIEESDPISAPVDDRVFWLNTVSRKLWVAIATNSPSDWIAIGGDTPEIDVASILNKILVQDGQVLTTDDHVIFED